MNGCPPRRYYEIRNCKYLPIRFVFDDSMASGDTDIIDSDFAFMSSAHIELQLFRGEVEYMNSSGSVLFKRQTFHHHEVTTLRLLNIHQFVYLLVYLE